MDSIPQRRLSLLALAIILLLHAVALSDELTISRLDTNDNVDHFLSVQGMVRAIEHGGNPLDWFTETPFGYPAIRNYQPLAYGLVAALYFALGKSVSLIAVFVLVRYLAIVLLPLSFYASARWMDLPRWTAVAAAALAPLVVTNQLYGLEYESYVWKGYGLFTQALAANLLVLTLGLGFRALRRGRPLMLSGMLLGLTFVAHFIYGYMGAASLCLLALLPDPEVARRGRILRTAAIGAVAFIVSVFQLLPLWLDGRLINPTHIEGAWKSDSFGAATVLKLLFAGDILDHGRLPVLSLLALAGVAFLLWRFRQTRHIEASARFALAGASFWLLIFFGRPTWGPLIYLLGIPREMHLHRVIAGLQIFLLLLAAVGLAAVWRLIERRSHRVVAAAAAALLILPAAYERWNYLSLSRDHHQGYIAMIEAERPTLDAVVRSVKERGGYVYAGLSTNWGNVFQLAGGPVYTFLSTSDVPQTSFSYHVMEMPADMLARFDELQPAHYRLFNVRSVVAPAAVAPMVPSFLTPRAAPGEFRIFDAPGAGYFDLVDALAAVPADRHSFFDVDDRWLHSPLVAQRGHLLLDFFGKAPAGLPRIAPAAAMPPDPYSAPPGEITGERHSGDVFEAGLNAIRPAFALFRMTWHQNWKATVDGRETPTFMLSPGFIGVPVPAGTHRLQLRYQPDDWRVTLALAGLLLALLLVAAEQTGRLRFPLTKIETPAEPEPVAETPKIVESARTGRGGPRARRQRR